MLTLTFLHVPERWIAEAVWTQGVALAPGPRSPQHKFKVIQWTAKLFVQLDGSILGKTVGLVTVGAVEPAGLGLQTHAWIRCQDQIKGILYSYTVQTKRGELSSSPHWWLLTTPSCIHVRPMFYKAECLEYTEIYWIYWKGHTRTNVHFNTLNYFNTLCTAWWLSDQCHCLTANSCSVCAIKNMYVRLMLLSVLCHRSRAG